MFKVRFVRQVKTRKEGQQVLVVVGDAKCAAKRSTSIVSTRKLVAYTKKHYKIMSRALTPTCGK